MKFFKYSLIIVLAVSTVVAQPRVKHRGVQLYEEGKYADAIDILEDARKSSAYKSNAEIWNYLGLAYLETNETKKAVKAFERAVKLNGASSAYHTNLAYSYLMNGQHGKARSESEKAIELDPNNLGAYNVRGTSNLWDLRLDAAEQDALKMIEIDPAFPPGYTFRTDVLVARLGKQTPTDAEIRDVLTKAVETLEAGAKKTVGKKGHQNLLGELDGLQTFLEHFSKPKPITPPVSAAPPAPGVTPFKILSKPRVPYTTEARTAGITGTIRVAVLLGSNGRVQHTLLLSRLGYGLDERVTASARQITFEPKRVDGKPVPAVATFEYNFSLY